MDRLTTRPPQASFEEFFQKFIECTRTETTYESAYLAAEQWHRARYGYNRFAGYESFRVRRSQEHRKTKNQPSK